ncbi:MAG: hypothetical protein ABMA25_21620, partial [Ilumatobacteraceae bacterium]
MAVDVRALYAVAPAEFVAARTALVKALKAEQRKDEAAAIQQLRRPRVAEHGLNLAARTEPGLVAQWAAAVSQLDAAQSTAIGGGGAASLREAAAELRDAHAAVLKAAVVALGDSGEAQRADINDTLRSLAHPDGVPLLSAGVVGSEQLGDFTLFAGAPDPVVQRERGPATKPTRTASRPVDQPAAADAPAAPPAPKIDLKRLRGLERAAEGARKEVAAADEALTAARDALAAAKLAVAAATDRAANARKAARDADAAVVELSAAPS